MLKTQTPLPEYFDRYINQVPENDLIAGLLRSSRDLKELDLDMLESIGQQVYAPGKWTIRDIFQHLCDTERVMSYRAMRIARNDRTPLPGFEENDYALEARAEERELTSIIAELTMVRASSIFLFESLTETMLNRKGVCSGKEVTAGALGFIIAGHQVHHLHIIRERYLPLLSS